MTAPQPYELRLAVAARRFFHNYRTNKKTGCHEWVGLLNAQGYGQTSSKILCPGTNLAHRIAWTVIRGPIPKGKKVLHKCDNPKCGNPSHLFLGTQRDNVADMMKKGRHRSHKPGKYMPSGKNHPMYQVGMKITRRTAEKIRGAKGLYKEIGKRFGVDPSLVSRIKNGHCWK